MQANHGSKDLTIAHSNGNIKYRYNTGFQTPTFKSMGNKDNVRESKMMHFFWNSIKVLLDHFFLVTLHAYHHQEDGNKFCYTLCLSRLQTEPIQVLSIMPLALIIKQTWTLMLQKALDPMVYKYVWTRSRNYER
jgi:hypothetical protein